jgi:hypothetical protein
MGGEVHVIDTAEGRGAWPRLRSRRRSVLAGALVLIAGVLAATAGIASGASGTGATHISATLGYRCQFPSGTYQVAAGISGALPAAATPGERIQPAGVRVTAALPRAAIDDLTSLGGASVTASGIFTVIEAAGSKSVAAQWPAQTSGPYQLPAAGGLQLTAAATAPPSAAGSLGTITFTASDLVLDLKPQKADGSATSPAVVRVPCALGAGVSGKLGVVTVTAPGPSPSPSGSASAAARPAAKAVKGLPAGCGKIKAVGTGTPTCGYITGYSDVAKLYGAALLQPQSPAKPGLVNVDFAESHKFSHGKLVVDSTAKLYYHGRAELPPVTATFLAFRFVPVKATLHLVELAPIKIASVSGIPAPPYPITVRASSTVSVQVSGVKVNGVPLDVGTHCQTVRPVKLVLIGKGDNTIPPRGYTVPTGGPLSGKVTIPAFNRCGVTENLDPLLTGSISGPGNFIKMTQGKLCGPSQPSVWSCPPPVPKPLR